MEAKIITEKDIDNLLIRIKEMIMNELEPIEYRKVNNISHEEFIEKYANLVGYTPKELFSKDRRINIKMCRFVIAYFLKEHYKFRDDKIGMITRRDRTTSISSYVVCQQLLETKDDVFMKFYNIALQILDGNV